MGIRLISSRTRKKATVEHNNHGSYESDAPVAPDFFLSFNRPNFSPTGSVVLLSPMSESTSEVRKGGRGQESCTTTEMHFNYILSVMRNP